MKKEYEWYNLRPILGNANWALFYILLGAREAGKSYAVTNFFVDQFVNKGIPFNWIRLTEAQSKKLLQNNAEKLIDPDIRRKYDLDLITNGQNVYSVKRTTNKQGKSVITEKKLMARVFNLSTYYSDKGSIYDKDFLKDPKMRYNIACDEFEREKDERNTFDILNALVNQLETMVRSTKDRCKIFFMGNTLEEASSILCSIGYIPEMFGTYRIKAKRAVIEYIEPSEAYKKRRQGTIADILMPNSSNFTNRLDVDTTVVSKERLIKPVQVIKFTKDKNKWFTIWNKNLITKYNGEKKPVIAMRPYLDEPFIPDVQKTVILEFDTRCFKFRNLITFKEFQGELALLKPRKQG